MELLREAEEVDPIPEIQVPGHLGQGRGAREAWGAGQGPDSIPAGGSHGPSFLPSLPLQRGHHPNTGTFGLSPGNTGALHVPSSGRWTHGELGQTGPGQHRMCPDAGLGAALSQSQPQPVPPSALREPLGLLHCSCDPDDPPDCTGLLHGLEQEKGLEPSPDLSGGSCCEAGLPARPACPSGWEQPGEQGDGHRHGGLTQQGHIQDQPPSRWGMASQQSCHCKARSQEPHEPLPSVQGPLGYISSGPGGRTQGRGDPGPGTFCPDVPAL